jgi:signal transduction histidine kinase/ActR/RegA family two-component response regulator
VTLVWEQQESWRIVRAEGDIEAMTGYRTQSFLDGGIAWADIIHELDGPSVFDRVGTASTGADASFGLVYRIVMRNGTERRVWDETRIQRDADGAPVRFVSYLVALDDMPSSHQAQAFIAHASHEVRTPLTGLVGLIEALAETPLAPMQRELVETLRLGGADLMQLVNNMLDLAKLDAGAMELDVSDFRVGALCNGAERLFGRRAKAKGVDFRVRGQAMDIALRGDGGRVRQIIYNLVSNAVKFTNCGRIELRWSIAPPDPGGRVAIRISVADTGPGMTEEELARVFESYQQADATIAARHGGTGLGLSIAKALAGMMGGRLWAESKPGQGATFHFEARFETAAEGQDDMAVLALEEANAAARARLAAVRPRVLAVEDSTAIQRVLDLLLTPMGAEVVLARDGIEALEQLDRSAFDLILMDSRLPRLGGLECTTEIRRREKAAGRTPTPILALTADTMPGTIDAFMTAGCTAFLPKPFEPQRLVREVAALLPEPALT